MLTTKQAAEKLGVSERYVQRLILDGKLPAERPGRDYLIKPEDLETFKQTWNRQVGYPKGRPRKAPPES